MFVIEIRDLPVEVRTIKGKDNKPDFEKRLQAALLHRAKDPQYPEKFYVALERNEAPKPPGKYTLSDENFVVDQYGELKLRASFGQLKLVPIARAAASAVGGTR